MDLIVQSALAGLGISEKPRPKEAISKMVKDSQIRLQSSEIQDKDRYVLNHKLETLQLIN